MAVKEKRMVTGRECRRKREFPKNRREKYVFILKKYLPLAEITIAVSTNKIMIIERARTLLQKLNDEIWEVHRGMPFHQGRTDEELRRFMRDNPDPTHYGIIIYDSNTGEFVDSLVITEKKMLLEY